MQDNATTSASMGDRIRAALDSADLTAIAALLDADVTWGAPDDTPSCRNRREVLAWYRRGYAAGVRARVTEMSVNGNRILVGLRVTGSAAAADGGGDLQRWQVLTVAKDRVVDIRAFDDREPAAARTGIHP